MPPIPISQIPSLLDDHLATIPELSGVFIGWQSSQATPPSNALWIRPVCNAGEIAGVEKGKDGYSRRKGMYLIDVYVPTQVDAADAWAMAAVLEKAFRRECIDGLQTEDPHTANMGVDETNKYSVRVTVPWWCWAA